MAIQAKRMALSWACSIWPSAATNIHCVRNVCCNSTRTSPTKAFRSKVSQPSRSHLKRKCGQAWHRLQPARHQHTRHRTGISAPASAPIASAGTSSLSQQAFAGSQATVNPGAAAGAASPQDNPQRGREQNMLPWN